MGWVSDLILLLISVVYALLLLFIMLRAEFACRRAQEKYSLLAAGNTVTDEDDYWIGGLFYHNPQNARTMVVNRVGMGTTVNLARPGGKALMIFALIAVLALPCVCAWAIAEEYTPLTLHFSGEKLTIEHLKSETVLLSDIRALMLIEELPPARRIVGSGMENLLKGDYDVTGYGKCRLFVNPNAPPFIVLEAKDATYFVNDGADADQTLDVYAALTHALGM